jgi:alpha-1,6-mannosyltransferase
MKNLFNLFFSENRTNFYFILYTLLYFSYFLFSFIDSRKDFCLFILIFFIIFIYVILRNISNKENKIELVLLGIIFRIATLGSYPILSDDWHRFFWDGNLCYNLTNPYSFSPSVFIEQNPIIPSILYSSYLNMNSKNYYSVYPPILQSIFSLPWLFNIEENAIITYQCFLLTVEVLNLFLIYFISEKKSGDFLLVYAINPLIVIESVSQIHFDSLILSIILIYNIIKKNNPYFQVFKESIKRIISKSIGWLLKERYLHFHYLIENQVIPDFVKNRIYLFFFILILTNIKISLVLSILLLLPNLPRSESKYILLSLLIPLFILIFIGLSGNQENLGLGLFVFSFRFNGIFETFIYTFLNSLFSDFTYLSGMIGIFLLMIVSISINKNKDIKVFYWNFFFYLFSSYRSTTLGILYPLWV